MGGGLRPDELAYLNINQVQRAFIKLTYILKFFWKQKKNVHITPLEVKWEINYYYYYLLIWVSASLIVILSSETMVVSSGVGECILVPLSLTVAVHQTVIIINFLFNLLYLKR